MYGITQEVNRYPRMSHFASPTWVKFLHLKISWRHQSPKVQSRHAISNPSQVCFCWTSEEEWSRSVLCVSSKHNSWFPTDGILEKKLLKLGARDCLHVISWHRRVFSADLSRDLASPWDSINSLSMFKLKPSMLGGQIVVTVAVGSNHKGVTSSIRLVWLYMIQDFKNTQESGISVALHTMFFWFLVLCSTWFQCLGLAAGELLGDPHGEVHQAENPSGQLTWPWPRGLADVFEGKDLVFPIKIALRSWRVPFKSSKNSGKPMSPITLWQTFT